LWSYARTWSVRTVLFVDDTTPSTCPKCAAPFEAHTEGTPRCTVCMRYSTLKSNAEHVRRGGTAPGLSLSLSDFSAWFIIQDRKCRYCRIDEEHLPLLGIITQVGHPLSRLGIDRLDGQRGYETDNIALCCFACNKAKSNTFSDAEMRLLGVGVAQNWTARLAAIGVHWQPDTL